MGLELSNDLLMVIAICATAILCGGVIKGTLGVGLPLFAVPVMSLFISSTQAIALVSIPVLFSNIWQVWQEGSLKTSLKRFWPLMLTQAILTVCSVYWTLSFTVSELNRVLAFALILAVVLMAFKPQFDVSPRRERWVSACVGMCSGMLGAVSSLTGPIIITYMMALRLSREQFMGGISIVYFFGSLPLYSAMFYYDRMGVGEVGLSLLALLPMAAGLYLGRFLGRYISEKAFRQVLFAYLLSMAALLVWR